MLMDHIGVDDVETSVVQICRPVVKTSRQDDAINIYTLP